MLIVEDILDSGKTLSYVKGLLEGRNPRSIKICTLLDKPERRVVDLMADYSGTEVPDEFVVATALIMMKNTEIFLISVSSRRRSIIIDPRSGKLLKGVIIPIG